jgi:hypothetical protein
MKQANGCQHHLGKTTAINNIWPSFLLMLHPAEYQPASLNGNKKRGYA